MSAIEKMNRLCNEIDQDYISYKITKLEEQKCILEVEMQNNERLMALEKVLFTVFIFDEQITFLTSLLGSLTDAQRNEIFPIVNNMNCDYSDFKFLVQEGNNGYYLEMRHYIDAELINDEKDWFKLVHYFAVGLDLAFREYAKDLARFI